MILNHILKSDTKSNMSLSHILKYDTLKIYNLIIVHIKLGLCDMLADKRALEHYSRDKKKARHLDVVARYFTATYTFTCFLHKE